MGVDHFLACNNCKEFVDCHKWPPHEEANSVLYAHFYPEYGVPQSHYQVEWSDGCPIVRAKATDLLREIRRPAPPHDYINQLKNLLPIFVAAHRSHDLFVASDLGPAPWGYDAPEEIWTAWKQIGSFHRGFPRNLVETMGLVHWDQALPFIEAWDRWVFDGDPEREELVAIQRAFERLVDSRRPKSWRELRRFWITSPDWPLCQGYGVTAFSRQDALEMLRDLRCDLPDPESILITEDVDLESLDPNHVHCNMGPIVVRGVWFPKLGVAPR